jgi:hypothetical protein
MTSLISTLSFLILVLSIGAFALPVDKTLPIVTESPLNLVTTSEHLAKLQLLTDDEANKLPNIGTKLSSDKLIGVEATTLVDKSVKVPRKFGEDVNFEQLTTQIPESWMHKYSNDDLNSKFESTTPSGDVVRRDITPEGQNKLEITTDKGEIKIDSKSIDTSSPIVPSVTTLEASTTKYIGRLEDNNGEEEEKPKKPRKNSPKKISTAELDVTTVPTAVFDQSALDNSNFPSDFLKIDETNDVVTDITVKVTTTPEVSFDEHAQLNEGKKHRA